MQTHADLEVKCDENASNPTPPWNRSDYRAAWVYSIIPRDWFNQEWPLTNLQWFWFSPNPGYIFNAGMSVKIPEAPWIRSRVLHPQRSTHCFSFLTQNYCYFSWLLSVLVDPWKSGTGHWTVSISQLNLKRVRFSSVWLIRPCEDLGEWNTLGLGGC